MTVSIPLASWWKKPRNTHSTVVLDTIAPELAGREFSADDKDSPTQHHLTHAKNPSRCVVQRQRVVDDVAWLDVEEGVHSVRHVEESGDNKISPTIQWKHNLTYNVLDQISGKSPTLYRYTLGTRHLPFLPDSWWRHVRSFSHSWWWQCRVRARHPFFLPHVLGTLDANTNNHIVQVWYH